MIRHVILWQLKDTLSAAEKAAVRLGIQNGLEGLAGKIPGLEKIKVHTDGLSSSSADLMLDALFTDEAALRGYAVHPAHVEVAQNKVRPFVKTRLCLDFEA